MTDKFILSNVNITDVETGEPITGNIELPIGYVEAVINGASPIPLGQSNPTLWQLAEAVETALPNFDLTKISEKLIEQGFSGNPLLFAKLGFQVRVLFNAGDPGIHKVEWVSTQTSIDQETGQIISTTSETDFIFVTADKLYDTAYGKVSELISNYPFNIV